MDLNVRKNYRSSDKYAVISNYDKIIVMAAITEEENERLNNGSSISFDPPFNKYSKIIGNGDTDVCDKDSIKTITNLICTDSMKGVFIPKDYDYDSHTGGVCIESFDLDTFIKFKHALIGKPTYICVFSVSEPVWKANLKEKLKSDAIQYGNVI